MYQAKVRSRVFSYLLYPLVTSQTALALCEHLRHLTSERAERYTGHLLPDAQENNIFKEGAGRLV